jgi:3,4-dihydroxy 2-butanone 4-phosphate synthase/GTP cyclohydrolase II
MKKQVSAKLPSEWGSFNVVAYAEDDSNPMPHVAYYHEDLNPAEIVYVRIHSECLTGDLLHSKRCDCGQQLEKSLEILAEKKGLLIYLRQEGRGIGLINKLKAYNLQDEGYDTITANHQLGFAADERRYEIAHKILKDLGITRIKLLTNNPLKVSSLDQNGVKVVKRVPIQIEPIKENEAYLQTKKDMMGHYLD